jgi:hypothetical protein
MNAFFEVYVSVATLVILLIIVAVFTKSFVFVVSQCVRYLRDSLTKSVNSARRRVSDRLATAARLSGAISSCSNKRQRMGASGESNFIAGSPEPTAPGTFAGILVHYGGLVRRVDPAYRPQSSRRPVRI